MGDSRPDNGAGWPPDDGSGGLPELPPEWGTIVIPDDAAELDDEAYAIRRELRRDARRSRLNAFLGRETTSGQPGVGVPLLIMAIAVLTTMVSLFVVTLGNATTGPVPIDTNTGSTAGDKAGDKAGDTSVSGLAPTVLRDTSGAPVRLGTLLPAVVLLIDGCDCPRLVREIAAKAPVGIPVVVVSRDVPEIPDQQPNVITLADPESTLRSQFRAGTPAAGAATVLVVDRGGNVVAPVTDLSDANDLPAIDAASLS